jgi:hypothetical protein
MNKAKLLVADDRFFLGMFASPGEQLAQVRRWNGQVREGILVVPGFAGYSDDELNEAERTAPPPSIIRLVPRVLVPYLPTPLGTFDFHWSRIVAEHGLDAAAPEFPTDEEHLRLLPGIQHPGQALRWETIDVGSNLSRSPESLRSVQSPHAAVLAAMALNRNWVRFMYGVPVPCVWCVGYECLDPFTKEWNRMPGVVVNPFTGRVRLYPLVNSYVFSQYSVPQYVAG